VATNKYINTYKQRQEQNLVQDLITECIKIHGIDAVYLPRQHQKVDTIYREDPLSYFNDYYHMEMYIKTVDGFEGDGELFTKFGLDIKNQITFSISRATFAKVVGKELIRPNEGDLIYIPLSSADGLYEIRHVTNRSVFYNLGEFYLYDVRCEQFAFQDENIKTGIPEIDSIANEGSQVILVNVAGGLGTFLMGETVYQGPSVLGADAKATIVGIKPNGDLVVKDVFNEFKLEYGTLKGEKSSASYALKIIDAGQIVNDFGAQNTDIPKDAFIDFTEWNPFSEDDL